MAIIKILGIIAIPISILVTGIVYKKFPKLKQDNIVEEMIENVIENQTGINVDLSPDTPEDHNENKIEWIMDQDEDINILLESEFNKLAIDVDIEE